jgi:hypothetical protein
MMLLAASATAILGARRPCKKIEADRDAEIAAKKAEGKSTRTIGPSHLVGPFSARFSNAA